MPQEIKVGSVVKLKSGGPKMTVNELKIELATCVWFAEGKDGSAANWVKDSAEFSVEALELVVEGMKPRTPNYRSHYP